MTHDPTQASTATSKPVAELVDRYRAWVIANHPVEATQLGDHTRDHDLPDLCAESIDAWSRNVAALQRETGRLRAALPAEPVGEEREAAGDLDLLQLALDERAFWIEQWPRLSRDPLAVVDLASASIHELLRRTDLPLLEQRERVAAATSRARLLPRLLEQAGVTLESSPTPHLTVALQRIEGVLALVTDDLPARAAAVESDVGGAREAGELASEGLAAFAALLSELGEQPAIDWRMGEDLHAACLRASLGSDLSATDIERRAGKRVEEMRGELLELAGSSWQALVGGPRPSDDDELVRRALGAVADTAVSRDRLLDEARAAVADARAFALDADLIDLPPEQLLTITEVPPFLQGFAVAFITPPPALDPESGCTYYLSPVPDAWDQDRAHSFLREYNPAQLRSLALHEAVPGHFVQLEHAARHPRLARRLLSSSAFAEGWAVYIEREAVRRGYGDDAYRLTQRKLELRIAANALLDVGLHAGGMSDDEAMALMVETTYQERAEAEGKLQRGKISQAQLCTYFAGGAEFDDLRDELTTARGAQFDVRGFHQEVLSHGTPTIAIARAALTDPTGAAVRRPFADDGGITHDGPAGGR